MIWLLFGWVCLLPPSQRPLRVCVYVCLCPCVFVSLDLHVLAIISPFVRLWLRVYLCLVSLPLSVSVCLHVLQEAFAEGLSQRPHRQVYALLPDHLMNILFLLAKHRIKHNHLISLLATTVSHCCCIW